MERGVRRVREREEFGREKSPGDRAKEVEMGEGERGSPQMSPLADLLLDISGGYERFFELDTPPPPPLPILVRICACQQTNTHTHIHTYTQHKPALPHFPLSLPRHSPLPCT